MVSSQSINHLVYITEEPLKERIKRLEFALDITLKNFLKSEDYRRARKIAKKIRDEK